MYLHYFYMLATIVMTILVFILFIFKVAMFVIYFDYIVSIPLMVINSYYKPSIKHEKGYKCNHHHRIGTQLTKLHEFWWIMIFQGLNRKNRNSGEELGLRNQTKSRQADRTPTLEDSRRHEKARDQDGDREDSKGGRPAPLRAAGLAQRPTAFSFTQRVITHLYVASWPSFQVGLIRGLWFIPSDYIARPRPFRGRAS
jgi:hypothetical protein